MKRRKHNTPSYTRHNYIRFFLYIFVSSALSGPAVSACYVAVAILRRQLYKAAQPGVSLVISRSSLNKYSSIIVVVLHGALDNCEPTTIKDTDFHPIRRQETNIIPLVSPSQSLSDLHTSQKCDLKHRVNM